MSEITLSYFDYSFDFLGGSASGRRCLLAFPRTILIDIAGAGNKAG